MKVSVAAVGAEQPPWNQPVDVYFRRTASGWQLVGVDRLPSVEVTVNLALIYGPDIPV